MPRYLYRIQPTRTAMLTDATERETEVVSAHFDYLKAGQGRVLLAGRTQTTGEDGFGIIIFEADSDAEAEAFVAADPAVANGVMTAELFPYRIAIAGPISEG